VGVAAPNAALAAIAHPGTTSISAPQISQVTSTAQPQSVTVSVPEGTTPVSAAVTLTDPVDIAVVAEISVGARVAVETTLQPRASRRVTFSLNAADVDQGAMTVSFAVSLPTALVNHCGGVAQTAVTPQLAPSGLTVLVSGKERMPTTVAAFFPVATPRVTVVVPPDAAADVLAAGLSAVAALADRYGSGTVQLVSAPPADHLLGERVVELRPASGATTISIDPDATVATLVLSGNGAGLQRAAAALSSPVLQLANASSAVGLRAQPAPVRAPSDLAGFGAQRISLSGFGATTAYVGIRQTDFGRPVSSIELHLVGTHSALPHGTVGVLDVYWNDFLVASQNLAGDTAFDLPVKVPASLMQGANGLRIEADVVPPTSCGTASAPFTLDIDGVRSTVSATAGAGIVSGFQRFPQVLGGTLPVALGGSGAAMVQNAELAAGLVAALQRDASSPLRIRLVTPAELLGGSESGLVVGATGADTDEVDARLRLYGMRLMYTARQQSAVGTNRPYAALEETRQHQRDLLIFGSWSPDGQPPVALEQRAVRSVTAHTWSGLSDDLLISSGDLPPFTVPSSTVFPQAVVVHERRSDIRWLWIGLGVLAVLLVGRWLGARTRRRRIAAYVDAQQRTEREDDPPEDEER